jgi:hypothetical protein
MISVGIASIPSRESRLKITLDSIKNQVDMIFLSLNGYEHAPRYLEYIDNLSYSFHDNSMGDAMKFAYADKVGGYFLTLDDDLCVSPNYVSKMISMVDKYGCPCSLHGKRYDIPVEKITSFRTDITTNVRCLHTEKGDTQVHVIGTGTLAFNTKDIKVSMSDFYFPNMADVFFSRIAKMQGVKLMAIGHKMGEVRYLYPRDKTIWQQIENDEIQTEILRKILS